jgi:hypothetical protein
VGSSCEHGNEPLGSMKGGEFLDWLSDVASQDGLCSMELIRRCSKTIPWFFASFCCSKLALVFQCTGCETISLQPLGVSHQYGEKPQQFKFTLPHGPPVGATCEHCSHKHHVCEDKVYKSCNDLSHFCFYFCLHT